MGEILLKKSSFLVEKCLSLMLNRDNKYGKKYKSNLIRKVTQNRTNVKEVERLHIILAMKVII